MYPMQLPSLPTTQPLRIIQGQEYVRQEVHKVHLEAIAAAARSVSMVYTSCTGHQKISKRSVLHLQILFVQVLLSLMALPCKYFDACTKPFTDHDQAYPHPFTSSTILSTHIRCVLLLV